LIDRQSGDNFRERGQVRAARDAVAMVPGLFLVHGHNASADRAAHAQVMLGLSPLEFDSTAAQ
jgi:hypothetical protein